MAAPTDAILGPEQGDRVRLNALGVRFMIDGWATGGRFSLVEHPLPPRALGSPVHTHRDEDEYSYVLEGQVGVQLGSQVFTVGPGDLVTKPRDVPHAFWNAGDEPARLLELISPAGFEDYFREMATALASAVREPAVIAAISSRYHLDIDRATAPILAERHHLNLG